MSDKSFAVLELEGKKYELPIIKGSEKERAIDISKLRSETGYVTLDPGFVNTGSCQSAITFLDGEKGILKYRGYPIETLAEKSHFLEVSYLLLEGHLPSKDQLNTFNQRVCEEREIPGPLQKVLTNYPEKAHPMGLLAALLVALSGIEEKNKGEDLTKEEMDEVISHIMGQIKLLCAGIYRVQKGLPLISSLGEKASYTYDFMHLLFGEDEKRVNDKVAKALDILLILHADHEQNCSASTVRVVGSSRANLYASLSSGVNALWGPLHGGANQAVVEMLHDIEAQGGDFKKFLDKAKDKNDPFRIMGFGHRVYKNFDPRAKIIKKACDDVLNTLGVSDKALDIARGLEEAALKDEYFVQRKLYPNVDFYSGIIYKALKIPVNMFTVMFALGRMPGWVAQWKEMMEEGARIARPRQIYTGATNKEYLSMEER